MSRWRGRRGRVTPKRPSAGQEAEPLSIVFALPSVPDDAPAALKSSMALRNVATMNGMCECGARLELVVAGGMARMRMAHEHECPAGDRNVFALYGAWRSAR